MNVNKIGLVVSIFGFISALALKDWLASLLWLIIISQDLRIIELEDWGRGK